MAVEQQPREASLATRFPAPGGPERDRRLLDAVSARLSSDKVTDLVGKVVIDGQDVAAVATAFLAANGLL